jgi:hypothetical protein
MFKTYSWSLMQVFKHLEYKSFGDPKIMDAV